MSLAQRTMRTKSTSPLKVALAGCRSAFVGIGCASGLVNLLALTGSFFMLQVYDRVIPSHSVPTLVGLALLAGGLYIFQGLLDLIRGRLLTRVGAMLDEALSPRVYDLIVQLPLIRPAAGDGQQPMRDLDQLRSFLSGLGPTALFDLPWMPLYLGLCFVFHPLIGWVALAGAVVLVTLTILTEVVSRAPAREAAGFSAARTGLAAASCRNAEVLATMGLGARLAARWAEANQSYLDAQRRASDINGGLGGLSKTLRMILQSTVLGVGGYLVIHQEASGGIMIASSILTSRALAPVELAIAHWRGFIGARQGWHRLSDLLGRTSVAEEPMALPAASSSLSVEGVSLMPPGGQRPTVDGVTFQLKAGDGLGVIGPSASGKSSLARALVGVWKPVRGAVRLDNAALDQWGAEALGRQIGYLPQDVELFDGTVAENIARFEENPDPEAIVAAATAAGVHEMIVRFEDGYEMRIGEGGAALSAGQRQRIALARALYRDPFLVVLDEPNSNLDAEGEAALSAAVRSIRQRSGIVVIIAHRPSILAAVDLMAVMGNGRLQGFGPKDEVLAKTTARPRPVPDPREGPTRELRSVSKGAVA